METYLKTLRIPTKQAESALSSPNLCTYREEYRHAKQLSEDILVEYEKAYPDLVSSVIIRLPRLETQQTNSIIRAEAGDTLTVVRGVIERLNNILIESNHGD